MKTFGTLEGDSIIYISAPSLDIATERFRHSGFTGRVREVIKADTPQVLTRSIQRLVKERRMTVSAAAYYLGISQAYAWKLNFIINNLDSRLCENWLESGIGYTNMIPIARLPKRKQWNAYIELIVRRGRKHE